MPDDPHVLARELCSRFAALIPAPKRVGRSRTTDIRAIVEALVYWHSTGCAWRHLPPPPRFPPWPTVYGYYRRLAETGAWPLIRNQLDKAMERPPLDAAVPGSPGPGHRPPAARNIEEFIDRLQTTLNRGKAVSARAARNIDRYRSFTASAARDVREHRRWVEGRAPASKPAPDGGNSQR
ncbi:MAG TPA: transposase [Azospirillum sp.]|nr:transposase [Azospirillum sp.]